MPDTPEQIAARVTVRVILIIVSLIFFVFIVGLTYAHFSR